MILELGLLLATKIGNRGVNDWESQRPWACFCLFWLPRARLIAYVYPLLPTLLNLSTHTPQVRIYSVRLIFVH